MVASAGLRLVEVRLGLAQELPAHQLPLRPDDHGAADRHMELLALVRERRAIDRAAQRLRELPRLVEVAAGEDDAELLAADPEERVLGTQGGARGCHRDP
jgi:hypothetical protein